MSDKKKTPSTEAVAPTAPSKKHVPVGNAAAQKESSSPKKPPQPSPKKAINFFMVILLLIIAGGIYLHQQGYINKYYPLVTSTFSHKSPLEKAGEFLSSGEEEEESAEPLKTSEESVVQDTAVKDVLPSQEVNPPEPRAVIVSPENSQEISLLKARLQALEEKIETLERPVAGVAVLPHITPGVSFLKVISNLQDLRYKIDQGLPFGAELEALRTVLLPQDFEKLQPVAKTGMPTLRELIHTFKKVGRILDQKESFQQATTFLEKGKALLGQLIYMEKINDQSIDQSTLSRMYEKRLRQGDVAGVLSDLEALDHEEEIIKSWLVQGKMYHLVHSILMKTKLSVIN